MPQFADVQTAITRLQTSVTNEIDRIVAALQASQDPTDTDDAKTQAVAALTALADTLDAELPAVAATLPTTGDTTPAA